MPSVVNTLPQPSGLTSRTFAGFSYTDLSQYFGISPIAASGIIDFKAGQELNDPQRIALHALDPKRFQPGANTYNQGFGDIPFGLSHLNEHPKGSHYQGDFNFGLNGFDIAKAFDRLFTIRPQSFTPGNIARAFGQTAIFTVSGGALTATNLRVADVPISGGGQHDADLVTSFATGASSFGQVTAGNPANKESFLNRISRVLGGVYDSLAVGGIGTSALATAAPAAETAGYVPALTATERVGNLAASGLATASSAFSISNISQVVISILGPKIGGALLAFFSGNVAQAIQILTTPGTSQPVNLFGPTNGSIGNSGSSGGSGGGFLPSQNTGQTATTSLILPIMGIGIVGLTLWYFLRKKA